MCQNMKRYEIKKHSCCPRAGEVPPARHSVGRGSGLTQWAHGLLNVLSRVQALPCGTWLLPRTGSACSLLLTPAVSLLLLLISPFPPKCLGRERFFFLIISNLLCQVISPPPGDLMLNCLHPGVLTCKTALPCTVANSLSKRASM